MRAVWGLFVSASLLGCGSTSSKTNLTFHVVPPMGDYSCIGVVGFEVVVSSGNQSSPSGPLLNRTPVLDPKDCHLTQPFSIEGIDIDSPASVTVTGKDGAGIPRVQVTGKVDNLRAGSAQLELRSVVPQPLPVLVVSRSMLFQGAALSDVSQVLITWATMGRPTLVSFTPDAYFSLDTGAYGVTNMDPNGLDTGKPLSADVTVRAMMQRTRLTAVWNMAGHYYDATP